VSIRSAGAWLHRRAENIAAGLAHGHVPRFHRADRFRYLFSFPIGWTSELSVITWLWLVLWGAAFVVKESEESASISLWAAGRRTRRAMGIISGISIVVLYAASLPASVKYITFMKVESASYLKIRFDLLFSI